MFLHMIYLCFFLSQYCPTRYLFILTFKDSLCRCFSDLSQNTFEQTKGQMMGGGVWIGG